MNTTAGPPQEVVPLPLDTTVNTYETVLAVGCGVVSTVLYYAAAFTGDNPPTGKKLIGNLAGSFVGGMLVTWVASIQPFFKVSALGAAVMSGVLGFVYGPTILAIAARRAARQYGFEAPPLPPGYAIPPPSAVPEARAAPDGEDAPAPVSGEGGPP